MPLLETRGAGSAKGFGLTAGAAEPVYIEDVFSTWLYTGTGSAQTITNGIDLAGKGGMVWQKNRSSVQAHTLIDTGRGGSSYLQSNTTDAAATGTNWISFAQNGFSTIGNFQGSNGAPYASWTFRKQPKFFDVVTYTGNGSSSRNISHSLGSTPGCIIVRGYSVSGCKWAVYHRSTGAGQFMLLNATDAAASDFNTYWGGNNPTSTTFSVGSATDVNQNGTQYVAYLFAHDAGGFGLTGTDNVISCGSYTGTGSAQNISLGWEPQLVLIKNASATSNWVMLDTMRGFTEGNVIQKAVLNANTSGAEAFASNIISITSTGFRTEGWHVSGETYIYIAIRRGPMKTPTTGTSVYSGLTYAGTGTAGRAITGVGFPPDAFFTSAREGLSGIMPNLYDRLRGGARTLQTSSTSAEPSANNFNFTIDQDGNTIDPSFANLNTSGKNYINWYLRRAPGFFDEVCYTGNNVYQQAQSHNLGVVPELIIVKRRDAAANWAVGCNFTNSDFQYLNLNSGADGGNTNAYTTGGFFGGKPTASTFILAQNAVTNASGATYVAYLFATLAGVSKVGTYTGTGTTLQIDCGFTGGARFVLIKRLGNNTDAGVGGWHVWDSARGIVSGNDPYLLLNSTAAEVTNTDYIDTYSAGFEISSTAPAAINASGGTFVFLAIA